MNPVTLTVVMADCDNPSVPSAEALASVSKIVGRFKTLAEVIALPLDDPQIQELGITVEPTVLLDGLVISVGKAPDDGYLVRAIKLALSKRCNCADGECCA